MKAIKQRVETAIAAIQNGDMVILVDDEHRENEGDIVAAAEKVTPEMINFMITHARGLVCVPMAAELLDRFELPMMAQNNQSRFNTAFTVSVEAAKGVTTGVSASDRATTILALVNEHAKAEDIVTPGHMFPLRAREGGVLERRGQTEGSVDLARLAGLRPAGIVCEVINEDGSMARRPDLEVFSQKYQMPLITIEDLVAYRNAHE